MGNQLNIERLNLDEPAYLTGKIEDKTLQKQYNDVFMLYNEIKRNTRRPQLYTQTVALSANESKIVNPALNQVNTKEMEKYDNLADAMERMVNNKSIKNKNIIIYAANRKMSVKLFIEFLRGK